MGEENKNWFARHRTAVLGIAIAVLILNLVVTKPSLKTLAY